MPQELGLKLYLCGEGYNEARKNQNWDRIVSVPVDGFVVLFSTSKCGFSY